MKLPAAIYSAFAAEAAAKAEVTEYWAKENQVGGPSMKSRASARSHSFLPRTTAKDDSTCRINSVSFRSRYLSSCPIKKPIRHPVV